MKSLRKIGLIVLFILPSLGLAAEDLPPGCVKQLGPGGCLGKSRIESIAVSPALSCLHLAVNNCNGGVVTVQNECTSSFVLGEIKIDVKAMAPKDSIELFRNASGAVKAKFSSGNFASYSPAKDDRLSIEGKVGNVNVRIQYTKTKPLCE